MNKFMPQIQLKLILFLVFTSFVACNDQAQKNIKYNATFQELRTPNELDPLDSVRRFNLGHSSGRFIKTVVLVSLKEQEVGLSGTQSKDFQDNEGALFWYTSSGVRRFWMPNTYFNLDLFFLDENLKVIDIDRNLEAHPGMGNNPPIKFSKTVRARHVLELKSGSSISNAIMIGDQLKVLGPLSLSQIESKIRQQQ